MPKRKQKKQTYEYVLHASNAILLERLSAIQLVNAVITVVLIAAAGFLQSIIGYSPAVTIVLAVCIGLVQLGIVAAIVRAASEWLHIVYIIKPTEIIVRYGTVTEEEEIFTTEGINEIHIDQSFLGKQFNYGTVKIMSITWKKPLVLQYITNPELYAEVIRQSKSAKEVKRMTPASPAFK